MMPRMYILDSYKFTTASRKDHTTKFSEPDRILLLNLAKNSLILKTKNMIARLFNSEEIERERERMPQAEL